MFFQLLLASNLIALTAFCFWPAARQPDMYDLTGVVHHSGPTTNKGHYVAFVRLPGQGWRRYDDANITTVADKRVLTNNALILSYTRRSGQAH